MHKVPWLWRFHAVHHSAERLYFINAFRNHPGDIALSTAFSVLPLALLGAPPTVMALFSVFASAHFFLQHANIDYRVGPLTWVLSVGEVHRWHHSRKLEEADANYGNVLLIWDVLFGTRKLPAGVPPENVGLADGTTLPTGYVAQLVSPFTTRVAAEPSVTSRSV
jgi:sterol desaturase/sphingolipid hydroxylase (fatty acid hydroxylase superfamily)